MKHYLLFWLLLRLTLLSRAQSLDPGFQPTTLFNQSASVRVLALAAQADGKPLVAGDFQAAGGALSNNIMRLHTNLTRDLSFRPAPGANGPVLALAVQPDGKVLIGGSFTAYAGTATGPVARLLPTGELDPTFQLDPALAGGQVAALAVQANGRVLVGGRASSGLPGGLVRLLPGGALDPAFSAGLGAGSGGQVLALAVQPADSNIVVGGVFISFNGRASQSLVRLLPTGSPDPGFALQAFAADAIVTSVAVLPTGTVLAGGVLNGYGGALRGFLPSGAPDARFDLTLNSRVCSIQVDAVGRPVVAGWFSYYITASSSVISRAAVRLLANGTLDLTFTPQYTSTSTSGPLYYGVLPLADGRILLGGQVAGAAVGLTVVSATGTADPTFDLGLQWRGSISQAIPQSDGSLVVQGTYTSFNSQVVNGQLQRLDPAGQLTQDRQLPALPAGSVYGSLFPQPDGQVYAVVAVRTCSGGCTPADLVFYAYYLRRIQANNTLDPAFNVLLHAAFLGSARTTAMVQQLSLLASGALLVRLLLPTQLNGINTPVLIIQPTGAVAPVPLPTFLQPSMPPAGQPSTQLRQLLPQPDGKLLVSYDIVITTGSPSITTRQSTLTRLLPTGSIDPTFAVATPVLPDNVPFQLGPLQPDGKLLLSGSFTAFAGVAAPSGAVRLLPDGTVDATFQPAASLAPLVPLVSLPDGRLLVQANSQPGTARLRRLLPNGTADATFAPLVVASTGYAVASWKVVLQPGDAKPLLYGDFDSVDGQQRIGLARLGAATPLAGRVESGAASPLTFYPNPAHQRATLVLPAALTRAGTVRLYDALGREVGCQPLLADAKELTLSLSGLPPGLYLLRCGAATGQLIVE